MSEIPQFQFFLSFYVFREHRDFVRKIVKSESNRSEDLCFFSLSLWPEEVQKNLYTAPCSKSLGTTASRLFKRLCESIGSQHRHLTFHLKVIFFERKRSSTS